MYREKSRWPCCHLVGSAISPLRRTQHVRLLGCQPEASTELEGPSTPPSPQLTEGSEQNGVGRDSPETPQVLYFVPSSVLSALWVSLFISHPVTSALL